VLGIVLNLHRVADGAHDVLLPEDFLHGRIEDLVADLIGEEVGGIYVGAVERRRAASDFELLVKRCSCGGPVGSASPSCEIGLEDVEHEIQSPEVQEDHSPDDWWVATPAAIKALLVASTVPGNPTARVKSSRTIDSNPNLAAAMAEKPTQKS